MVKQVQARAQAHLSVFAHVGQRERSGENRGPSPSKRLLAGVLVPGAFALLTRRGGDVDAGSVLNVAAELTADPQRRVRVVEPREDFVVDGIHQRYSFRRAVHQPAPLKKLQLFLGPLQRGVNLARE